MPKCLSFLVVVVLPNPFRGVEELHRDPTVGHASRFGPGVNNGRSIYTANDGAPERLSCGTIQEEVS